MRGMLACAFCGAPVEGNYHEVTGWQRKERGHGLNHLMLRRETGRHACDVCGYDLRHGVEPGTPKLFPVDTPPMEPPPPRRDHA